MSRALRRYLALLLSFLLAVTAAPFGALAEGSAETAEPTAEVIEAQTAEPTASPTPTPAPTEEPTARRPLSRLFWRPRKSRRNRAPRQRTSRWRNRASRRRTNRWRIRAPRRRTNRWRIRASRRRTSPWRIRPRIPRKKPPPSPLLSSHRNPPPPPPCPSRWTPAIFHYTLGKPASYPHASSLRTRRFPPSSGHPPTTPSRLWTRMASSLPFLLALPRSLRPPRTRAGLRRNVPLPFPNPFPPFP